MVGKDCTIFSWNIRGAASREVKQYLRDLLFDTMRKYWESLGFLPVHIVEAQGHSGGLWCLASSHCISCYSLVEAFDQAVTVEVRSATLSWVGTDVYASPVPSSRELCWHYLVGLRQRISQPWMIVGDFNDSLLSSDQRGGVFSQTRANLFAGMIHDCSFIPLHTIGLRFSWVRRFHSDHSPVLVRCGGRHVFRGARPFRFEAAWLSHSEYEQVVASAWVPQENLTANPRTVQEHSLVFNREVFGDILRRKHTLEARIRGVQLRLDKVDSASLSLLHDQLPVELHHTLAQEELLWFQKSREQEAMFGGRNTRYFHTKISFGGGATKSYLSPSPLPLEEGRYPCPMLSQAHGLQIVAEVTPQEFWEAVSTMGSFKAPSPDGFQPIFFKSFWHIVGDSAYKVVREAFATGSFDGAISETLVALIPKVDVPTYFRELRPISLCNVMYKIITKVLVLRLRTCLQEIVGPLQSSFIPERGTSDNAIILQEVAHFMMSKKRRSRNVLFKLDLEKAYDQVSWSFLRSTLVEFGFPLSTVDLIMHCATSSSVTLLWNGNRLPAFSATRGLRQGDPLSPYLFVLCLKRLAHSLMLEENNSPT
ncbi:uncharacterized protein LOC130718376 [Lotus japonicus]|uniref:uncharacterized protein LOC130718376 n=1 Tax=Lotus japonicus TaxID=34305 RepID=UPI002586E0DA|nr:uncharacterized protein LOC130718376 [Lotus japonicus]